MFNNENVKAQNCSKTIILPTDKLNVPLSQVVLTNSCSTAIRVILPHTFCEHISTHSYHMILLQINDCVFIVKKE